MADIRSLDFLPATKVILMAAGAVTLPCLLGVANPGWYYHSWPVVKKTYQIWRPLTNFLYVGRGGFPLLFDSFCLYQTSTALEKDAFGDTAVYAWMLLMLSTLLLIVNSFTLHMYFLFKPLLTAMLYLWTKANPSLNISIFGLVKVPARLYPLTLIFLELVQNGQQAALGGIMGLIVGHIWWFCSTYLPLQAPVHLRRQNPLAIRPWFRRQFAALTGRPGARSAANRGFAGPGTTMAGVEVTRPRDDNAAAEVRHRWGSGQKLGGSGL